ncbi:hypothetical protein Taro_040107 [Colocasia esculenta]|uniref:Uncharacterized protein n=1 Tax=Colocasia esculenta TaxID=4460 RepID=A0A843WCB1_COLES|nr:hypothetical protein [Colocasia esculenta]
MKHRVTSDSNNCTTRTYGVGSQVEHNLSVGLIMHRSRGYNHLVDHVGIHGQKRLTEALNKDSLVRQKEYPTDSSSKSRESVQRSGVIQDKNERN